MNPLEKEETDASLPSSSVACETGSLRLTANPEDFLENEFENFELVVFVYPEPEPGISFALIKSSSPPLRLLFPIRPGVDVVYYYSF